MPALNGITVNLAPAYDDTQPAPVLSCCHAANAAPSLLVMIGCGARKLDHPAPAADLYCGPYFRSCLAAALAAAPRSRVLILSARHGLVGLDETLAPYDLRMGGPGCVTAADVAAQAEARGLAGADVLALCSARYADVLRVVFPRVVAPLAGLGIGRQRGVLARICREGVTV